MVMSNLNTIKENNLVLENMCLGRGDSYFDEDTRRYHIISTKSIKKWKINELDYEELTDPYDINQFFSSECYTLLWTYNVGVTVKNLKGIVSKKVTEGCERFAYFNWCGEDAKQILHNRNPQFKLGQPKGPSITINQGCEFPAFVRLFKVMFIHKETSEKKWRLYQILGNLVEEIIVLEVICQSSSLRSRGSMLFINTDNAKLVIWHGCKSLPHTRKLAEHVVKELRQEKNKEKFGKDWNADNVVLKVIEEDQKSIDEITDIFGEDVKVQNHGSLLGVDRIIDYMPRLFAINPDNVSSKLNEVLYPLHKSDLISPFPFSQLALYANKPSCNFMIENGDFLWVWITTFLDFDNNTDENTLDKSKEKRDVFDIVLSYWRTKNNKGDDPYLGVKGFVVWNGTEPTEFKALFPCWTDNKHNSSSALAKGGQETVPLMKALSRICINFYPLSVLGKRPLPDDVDHLNLELHLSDKEFRETFNMNKDEFDELIQWKKEKLKKDYNLF